MTKKNWLLVGIFGIVVMLLGVLGLGLNNAQDFVVYATNAITSASTTWSGEMTCDEDVTISSSVVVTEDTTLNIGFGKTLTLQDGLTIKDATLLDVKDPGTLIVSKENAGSSGALVVEDCGNFVLSDGRVIVNATGTSDYGFLAGDLTTSVVANGALIIEGGTKAGMKANAIVLKRGLLRVNSVGDDSELTYGILMNSLDIGDYDNVYGGSSLLHPTLEVFEPSENSYGIAEIDTDIGGTFNFGHGFVECQAGTSAIRV